MFYGRRTVWNTIFVGDELEGDVRNFIHQLRRETKIAVIDDSDERFVLLFTKVPINRPFDQIPTMYFVSDG